MKLSEQLISLAEWWFTTVELPANDHMLATYAGPNAFKMIETNANLCLLEAEYQKDIESDKELEQAYASL